MTTAQRSFEYFGFISFKTKTGHPSGLPAVAVLVVAFTTLSGQIWGDMTNVKLLILLDVMFGCDFNHQFPMMPPLLTQIWIMRSRVA